MPAACCEQLIDVEPREATIDEVCRFHSRAYVDKIQALSDDNGGDAGFLTAFGPGSFEIALRSAGGTIAAVDAVLDGAVDNCYALVRPPGHHAIADSGMGFCLFGNVAIAVHHARQARGLARVAVVDWDVHHGNGTQAAFYEDPSVLTISLHQDNCFPPGSGPISDTGSGAGDGLQHQHPAPAGLGPRRLRGVVRARRASGAAGIPARARGDREWIRRERHGPAGAPAVALRTAIASSRASSWTWPASAATAGS